MTDRMEIAAGERGVVRLFAIDLSADALAAFSDPRGDWPLQAALGAETLNPDYVQVFDAADVADIGLTAYLIEGAGIPEGQIAADRARLDTLTGPLVTLTSGAFGGRAQTLRPRAPLRWLGTWQEEAAPVQFAPLPSESARGHLGTAGGAAPRAARKGAYAAIAVIVAALVAMIALWAGGRL